MRLRPRRLKRRLTRRLFWPSGTVRYTLFIVEIGEQNLRDFEAAAKRSLKDRIDYGFIWTYKPVLDDAPYRSFETMSEYREWCEVNLPRWLGYSRV